MGTQCSPYTQDSYDVEVFAHHRAVETKTTYIHTDALRSPVAETNPTGAVTKRYTYEPYGAPANGTYEQGPGYTGHVTDALTGLSYMQQRYYDPMLGVFLSVDPVTAYSNPVGLFHRYRYANNNPYKFTDPDGRESACVSMGTMCGQGGGPTPTRDAVASAAVDFVPVVGDVKGIVEAVQDPSVANVVAAAVGLVPIVGDVAGKVIKNADNIADGVRLNKQLGSEQQLGEVMSGKGEVIAGGSTGKELRAAPGLAEKYGGNPSDWTKVSSSSHTAPDGQQFSTHAYQNQATGQVVEPKTKLIEEGR